MKTENQKQDTEEVYLNQLIDEANKEFSLDRKLAKKVALKFAKWQQEQDKNMYNEEDLREAFRQGEQNINYSEIYGLDSKLTEQEWFEQFKKQ